MKRYLAALVLGILAGMTYVEATDGPLTALFNLRGRTDENGYLLVSAGTPGVTDGPLTALSNLRGRTDENGYVRVSCSGCSGSGSGNAPSDATFITQTANSTLSAEQALGSLATGLMNSATTTGVVTTLAPTDDNVLVGSGTAWALKALTSCSAASSAVTYNTTTNAWGCNSISTTITGTDTQVMFFDGANNPAGDAGMTYDKTTDLLTVSGLIRSGGDISVTTATSGSITIDAVDGLSLTSDTGNLSLQASAGNASLASIGAAGKLASVLLYASSGNSVVESSADGMTFYDWTFYSATGVFESPGSIKGAAYVTTTTSPAVANIGADSCGTSAATIAGTDSAWRFTVGATLGTACRVTFDTTAPNAWECAVNNQSTFTLNAIPHQTGSSTTTVDISATAFTAGDIIHGVCFAR